MLSGLLTPGQWFPLSHVVRAQYTPERRVFRLVPDYDSDALSKKVLRIILSYTDYVNRVVWKRY